MTHSINRLASISVFGMLVGFGIKYSQFRDVWTDEVYGFFALFTNPWRLTIQGIVGDGNRAPLFPLLGKLWFKVQLLIIPFSERLDSYTWGRLLAIIPMAIFAAVLFYETAKVLGSKLGRVGSLAGGTLATLGFVTSYSFLGYFWQFRFYGLWALFSFLYSNMILKIADDNKPFSLAQSVAIFVLTGALTATATSALLEVGFAGLFLLSVGLDRKLWIRFGLLSALPVMYCLFCKSQKSDFSYIFPSLLTVVQLVSAHLRLRLLSLVLLLALVLWRLGSRRESRVLLTYLAASVLVAFVLLSYMRLHSSPSGFVVPNRYFLFFCGNLWALFLYGMRVLTRNPWTFNTKTAFVGVLMVFLVLGQGAFEPFWASAMSPGPSYTQKFESGFHADFQKYPKVCFCIAQRDFLEVGTDPQYWYLFMRVRLLNERNKKQCHLASPLNLVGKNEIVSSDPTSGYSLEKTLSHTFCSPSVELTFTKY